MAMSASEFVEKYAGKRFKIDSRYLDDRSGEYENVIVTPVGYNDDGVVLELEHKKEGVKTWDRDNAPIRVKWTIDAITDYNRHTSYFRECRALDLASEIYK